MVLTVSFVLSPVIGLLSPSSTDMVLHCPVGLTKPRSSARRLIAHGPKPALRSISTPDAAASTASRTYVRDDRETPLCVGGMATDIEVIWVGCEAEYFFRDDWTTQITLIQFDKIVFRRRPSASSAMR
jgi:hypothetical protein